MDSRSATFHSTSSEGRSISRYVNPHSTLPLRRLVVVGLAALSGLIAYAIVAAMAHGSRIDAQVRVLSAENLQLQQQVADRRSQIAESNSTDWLEEQARRLGFVFPGETIYILTAPGAKVPSSGGINAVLPTYAPSPSNSPAPPSASAAPTPASFVLTAPTSH